MTEVVVQLRDAEPRNPVPPEVRMRKALKALLRDYGLRAEWAPTAEALPHLTRTRQSQFDPHDLSTLNRQRRNR